MKTYQRLLIIVLFYYILFTINWFRNYDDVKNVNRIKETELSNAESKQMVGYSKEKVYFKYTKEEFDLVKTPIPGFYSKVDMNIEESYKSSKKD
jgi:hypothetical protein